MELQLIMHLKEDAPCGVEVQVATLDSRGRFISSTNRCIDYDLAEQILMPGTEQKYTSLIKFIDTLGYQFGKKKSLARLGHWFSLGVEVKESR